MSEEKEKTTKKKTKDEESLGNKCPACNASIKYNAGISKFKCEYCGSEFILEELQKYSNNASTKEKNEKKEIDDYDSYISYRCESCGAEIIADEETASTFCVYCGNTAILKSKLSGKFTPDKIIPFKKTETTAKEAFKALRKGRPLMPRDFNSIKNIEKIKGVYIPFWLYDISISGDINLRGEIVSTWRSGDTTYTKTDIYDIVRGGTMNFYDIPVDGSTRFDNDIMNTIEPFHYDELVEYNHAYLSGFYAEKYDTGSEELYSEAASRAIKTAEEKFQESAVGYSSKRMTKSNLTTKQNEIEYALLPVWMVNVKYKDKMYLFAMNGQTGEFVGNIPLDKKRVLLFTIIIFVISLLVTILISFIIYNASMGVVII